MAQNKYLQLLRNSSFAANYDAAVALIEANAPKMDGAPIVVRFTEGEKTHALLGISYNADGAVHFVELGGERIKDIKEALEKAIEAAKKAATTKVENKADDAHIKVTPSEPDTDGAVTYTVEGVDIASASATTEAISDLTDDIKAINDKIGGEYDAENTVADAIADLDEKIGAIKVVSSETATSVTYTVEGAAEGSVDIVVDKDDSLKSVELGKIVEGEFVQDAKGDVIRFIYSLADGTEKTVDINMSHVITEAELDAIVAAVDNSILEVENGKVAAAIAAAQTAAANVQSALTAHESAFAEFQIANAQAIGDAEAAAKAYASGYTEEKIAGLSATTITEEGKAIVSIEQANGVVSAATGNIDAQYVDVADAAGKFSGATVEAVLAELDDKIQKVQGEALGIEAGVAIAFGTSENGNTIINVKVDEAEDNKIQVTEGGLYVAPDVDYVVEAGNGISVSEKADEKQTISVKLKEVDDQALTCDADGVYLSNVWDCGTF